VHPHHATAIPLILPALAVTFGYIAACAGWPYTACRRCAGAGKRRSPSGRAWRYCHRCKGTGARLRTGRWIWNLIRRLLSDSTR
jgi:hypothetical protein